MDALNVIHNVAPSFFPRRGSVADRSRRRGTIYQRSFWKKSARVLKRMLPEKCLPLLWRSFWMA
jgi:hypothetical protein